MPVVICGKRYRGSRNGVLGLLFIVCSWLYVSYCTIFVLIKHFVNDDRNLYTYGYCVLSLLTFLSLLQAVKSDPGKVYAVSRTTAGSLGWTFCETCEKCRPPRSHHCSRCGRCVRKMDHHCIWINNCVGEDNLGIFIRFTCYAWLQSALSLLVLVFYYMNVFEECHSCPALTDEIAMIIRLKMFLLAPILIWLVVFLSGLVLDRGLLIAAEMTTLEMMKNRSLLKARIDVYSIYCVSTLPRFPITLIRDPNNPGIVKNMNHAFGTNNFFTWVIPCCCGSRIKPSYEAEQVRWTYEV